MGKFMRVDVWMYTHEQMIAREDFMTLVHAQQFHHWQTFLTKRSEVAATGVTDNDTNDTNTDIPTDANASQ